MIRLSYLCTLCSDLLLNSSSASEGVSKSLSYIPGAKFLGIVAGQLYDESNPDTIALFHSGKVRFGDAHPYVKDANVTMVPASWYLPKGQEKKGPVYLHHKLSASRKTELITEDNIQLKRAKDFYVTEGQNANGYERINVEQRFSLKTAFDASQRRSKEGQLFGYYAIPAGSVWEFNVDLDDETHADLLDKKLVGQRRMGRSRSAQYGLIKIKAVGRTEVKDGTTVQEEVSLLAHSNLAFYDQHGRPTVRPTPEQLNLPAGSKILWDQSRIRHRRYATRNAKRRTNNPDRLIITKGSVITVLISEPLNTSVWLPGVGAHRAEGFGQLVANPKILQESTERQGMLKGNLIKAQKIEKPHRSYPIKNGKDDHLIKSFLDKKSVERDHEVKVLTTVNKFIAKYSRGIENYEKINNSQWGQIRQLARRHPAYEDLKENLFSKEKGQLYAGQSQSVWRKQGRGEKLMNAAESLPSNLRVLFLQKLAAEMPKIKPLKK
jgi:hypothetical protein